MGTPSRLRRMVAGCLIAALGLAAGASAQTAGKGGVNRGPAKPANPVVKQEAPADPNVPAGMAKGDVQAVRGALRISAFSLVDLDLPAFGTPDEAVLKVRLGGVDHDLVLTRYSMRSSDFRVLTTGADGRLVEVPVGPSITFRGSSAQDRDATVRVGILDGRVEGTVTLTNGTKWGIQSLAEIVPGANPRTHVVYQQADIYPTNKRCPVGVDPNAHEEEGGEGEVRGTGLKMAELAMEVDNPYYVLLGSSVPNVVNDVELTMNNVENIYENDVDITYEITTIHIWTVAADPYSGSSAPTILNQFEAYWNSNFTGIRRDVAHMFTGTNLDDPVLGIANLSVLCNVSNAYGLVQTRWSANAVTRACLSAHELGHNWSAQHCDSSSPCNIMCSALGGCTGNCTSFGVSVAGIVAYRNSRTCLNDVLDPITLPFTDDFTTAITGARWLYNFGVLTADSPIPGAPTAPRIMRMNSAGSGDFHDDDIRSNFILAAGQPALQLRFFYAKRNVEVGETLIVEYWASTLRWNNITTIVSDGVTSTGFTEVAFPIPTTDGDHDELRIRFRVDGDQTDDEWLIDNVYVGEPIEDAIPLPVADQFPSIVFDPALWTAFQGEINSAALAEPSSPNSAELDGSSGAGEQIMTKPLLAADVLDVNISYWVERRGVEAGESLTLEARNTLGAWNAINTLVSPGGADQTVFTQFTHVLNTAEYLYDGLRFRWKSACNNTTDNWFIDDLNITATPKGPVCIADWDGNGIVNSTDVGEFINAWFADQANGTLIADWDGNGIVNSTDVGEFINDYFAAPPECLG